MNDYEVRTVSDAELRFLVDEGRPRIDGRAIVYNVWSLDLGGFRERMMPGSAVLDSDLVALFDHDSSMVLGRTSAGTMQAAPDSDGILFTTYPPDTQWARDLRVSMDRGDIKGCSYRMQVTDDLWYVEEGTVCRDVISSQVSELTVTSMPAYPQTKAVARCAVQIAKVLGAEKRAGRVLSEANEQVLKDAVEMIETASENIESVIVQVDPAYVDDDDEDTTDGPDAEDAASDASSRSTGAAPGLSKSGYVPRFGFVPRKER